MSPSVTTSLLLDGCRCLSFDAVMFSSKSNFHIFHQFYACDSIEETWCLIESNVVLHTTPGILGSRRTHNTLKILQHARQKSFRKSVTLMAVASLVTRGICAPANVSYIAVLITITNSPICFPKIFMETTSSDKVARARTNLIIKHEENNCLFYLYACETMILLLLFIQKMLS